MKEIALQSVIIRKKEIVAADMDGEMVLMSIENGKYYNLGKTGGVIWGLLEKAMSVDVIVEVLMERYDVTRQQCEEDVQSFLSDINKEGLLEVQ